MEKRSKVLIEPQQKVLETLQLAVRQVGLEAFSKRVEVNEEQLKRMLVGEQWIPMYTIREACEINKYTGGPTYTKSVSSCIEGTLMKMEGGEPTERRETAVTVEEIKPKETEKAEKTAIDKEKYAREEAAINRILLLSTGLSAVIFVLGVVGYWIGKNYGPFYAGVGLFSGIIVSFIIILLIIFKLKTSLLVAQPKKEETQL
jgi:hypothetical protein